MNERIILKEGLTRARDKIWEAFEGHILRYYEDEGYEKAILRLKELMSEVLEDINSRKDIKVTIDYSTLYGHTESKQRYNPRVDPLSALQLYLLPYRYAIPFVEGKDVLDVGCGYGYGVGLFSRYARSVIGLDYERDVIRYARRHYSRENCRFVVHDANLRYPFDDESFDIVFVSNVLEQLKEYEYSINEMKRVLRKGGWVIIKTRNRRYVKEKNPYHVVLFDEVELSKLLEKGFVDIELRGYNILYFHQSTPTLNPKVKKEYGFGEPIPMMYKYEIEGFFQPVMVKDPKKAGFLIIHGKK